MSGAPCMLGGGGGGGGGNSNVYTCIILCMWRELQCTLMRTAKHAVA